MSGEHELDVWLALSWLMYAALFPFLCILLGYVVVFAQCCLGRHSPHRRSSMRCTRCEWCGKDLPNQ
jgi:hypothetical protein